MNLIKLDLIHQNQLLELEEKMYWYSGRWKELWEKKAKNKFNDLIADYLQNFSQGCFGLTEKENLIGAMFLLKVSKLVPIPYVNKVSDYLDKDGNIAYVSFFVVKKGGQEKEIAQNLYEHAKEVTLFIGCKKIAVTINVSPLEEEILKENNYKKLNRQFQWEIYPGIIVPSHIYHCSLLI